MNIFYLDHMPDKAAKYHCDKHVVKMILEYAQLLCSVFHLQGIEAPYKLTHKNHPCAIWVRESKGNFDFLVSLLDELFKEYTARYNKQHATYNNAFLFILYNKHRLKFNSLRFTTPPQCMPDAYMAESTIDAYRSYYIHGKANIVKYNHSEMPYWYEEAR